jgi:hypothetical protein
MTKGFTCECGKYHEFGVWVVAHWREPLTHTCECGRVHHVRLGVAVLKRRIPKPKAEKPE